MSSRGQSNNTFRFGQDQVLPQKIKAAQDLLKDVRRIFLERTAAKKAAMPPKETEAKRKAKAKAKSAAEK